MNTCDIKYPLGNQTFKKIIRNGKLYVDKTSLVYQMTHTYDYVFLSRPRRFGKSLLVSTLASYFRGEKDLFKGLAMEHLETEWKQYPVIHLSLASVKNKEVDKIEQNLSKRLKEIEKNFNFGCESSDLGDRLKDIIVGCYEKYNEEVIFCLMSMMLLCSTCSTMRKR